MAFVLVAVLAAALFAHDLAAFRVHAAADLGGDGCRLLRRPALRGLFVGGPGWAGGWGRGCASGPGPVRGVGPGFSVPDRGGGSPRPPSPPLRPPPPPTRPVAP